MSTATGATITVQAHQTHWYDLVGQILKAINVANPFLISFIPAPVEAGIQITTGLGPVVLGTIVGETNPNPPPTPQPSMVQQAGTAKFQ